ncbi:MAG: DNA polymerase III subunit epsilon, partial [Variovorax sp.]
MKIDRGVLAVAVAPGLVLGAVVATVGAGLAATLAPDERAAVAELLAPRVALLLMAWALLALALGLGSVRVHARAVAAPRRLAEAARAAFVDGSASPLAASPDIALCSSGVRALAECVDLLAAERAGLHAAIDVRVQAAARGIEEERGRLAALMSELTQSVVVCNLDGRILLYNLRARWQFRTLSNAPAVNDGAELIGLGRSIYAVFDRQVVVHALDSIRQRLLRGVVQPSAQFVTSARGGQLLRVQLAAVRDASADAADPARLTGFVLMLHDITREFEHDTAQDRLLHDLTEGSRASLGSLQAALDMLALPDLEAPMRERFGQVVRDEVRSLSARIQTLTTEASRSSKTRWPLEHMPGTELVAAAHARIEALTGLRVTVPEVDPALWLQVDGYALLQALVSLASRLEAELAIGHVQLRLGAEGARAHLDLAWHGTALSTETALGWESEPMRIADEVSLLSVRDVVDRHGGEFWFQRERIRHEAFFRFLLPLAAVQSVQAAPPEPLAVDSRPEYYDFDLFQTAGGADALDDRRLADLSYTVFDTETTGLDPAENEILQIGAVRIVNGRLLRQECFEQLVDPGRRIPEASIAIHGITQAMVTGQPAIDRVLPAFHAFASDTVLVAHNAAFDMRFLQ